MLFASYPSTPASDLHAYLTRLRSPRLQVIQTEDQAAGVGAALGAAFGGALGVSACSSPGLDVSAEGLGLAVMTELPLVFIVLQRAGPSTGLPSKSEQTDLLAALFGRHGECPLPVLAASSPADCFSAAYEAVQLAVRGMTPVILLADGLLAAGIEPWRIPRVGDLPAIHVHSANQPEGVPFAPYKRDARHFRAWAFPGTPGLEHRLGGLEQNESGHVTYDPLNHERMVQTRAARIASLAAEIPPLVVAGPETGDVLVVGWGSTFGSIRTAVENAGRQGLRVAHAHLRHLHPLPSNLGEVLGRYRRVLVPELNSGHLRLLLRATFLVDAVGLNKIQGRPLMVSEIEAAIGTLLRPGGKPDG
jgi:2-oxoglutarate ferredoxin oxidoreductase subunit alpha